MKSQIYVGLFASLLALACDDTPEATTTDAVEAIDAALDAVEAIDAALDAESPPEEAFRLELRSDDEAAVGVYTAVISDGSAQTIEVLECASSTRVEGALAACEGGALWPEQPGAAWITIKALGFEHAVVEVDPDARGIQALTLRPLPEPEVNEDFATGLMNAATFEALAVPFVAELGPTQVVKFYIDDLRGHEGPPTVYFQDTQRHPLHYDFYRSVLGRPGTRASFEEATYHGEAREALAGMLVAYPDLEAPFEAPVALTFFPSDDLSPAIALRAHQLIEARAPFLARRGISSRLLYLPAGANREAATLEDAEAFARADAPWASQREVYGGLTQQLLNDGVAYGALRRMSPESLVEAVVSFQDILLLTRLPNDLPLVGGTLTEELQAPLAHVNVAARSRGTPNMALLEASAHPEIAPLIDALVRLEVADGAWSIRAATLEEARAFWADRAPTPFSPAADVTTEGLLPFSEIGFADASRVGVKAANLAELHDALGALAPDGFAVPFSHYERFIQATTITAEACDGAEADCLDEGRASATCASARALCAPPELAAPETVASLTSRLLADPRFQADSVIREAALDGLRWVIRHASVDPELGALLDAEVAARFGEARVRLRSSTNAEDLAGFSGAGLYKSVSADTRGGDDPSDEIRKVWASAWSWRAFEERAFWGIEHAAVKVGVAVHKASPDEALNGVLITRNLADPTIAGYYVNVQIGEASVTNPTHGATPEIFTLTEGNAGVEVIRQRLSSLSPDAPLMSEAELTLLYSAALHVQRRFEPLYALPPGRLVLDLEFKLDGPDRHLIIKQARPYAISQE